jgi:hypothetical protein
MTAEAINISDDEPTKEEMVPVLTDRISVCMSHNLPINAEELLLCMEGILALASRRKSR